MTLFTWREVDNAEEIADKAIAHARIVLAPNSIQPDTDRIVTLRLLQRAAADIEDAAPGFVPGTVLHECHGPACHLLTDEPVFDDEQVKWLGDSANTYCSEDCLSAASEEYWTARQCERDSDLHMAHQTGLRWTA